jgi:hypothetical protein
MAFTVKEYNQVVLAKRNLKELWKAACAVDGITGSSATFIIFSNGNPKANEYNTAMCEYMKMIKRIKTNEARRAKHAAMKDLGLNRVVGAQGGVYYE